MYLCSRNACVFVTLCIIRLVLWAMSITQRGSLTTRVKLYWSWLLPPLLSVVWIASIAKECRKWPFSLTSDCSSSNKTALIWRFAKNFRLNDTEKPEGYELHFLALNTFLDSQPAKAPKAQIIWRIRWTEIWLKAKMICKIFTICHNVQPWSSKIKLGREKTWKAVMMWSSLILLL